ncbi:MAG: HdeD family acid-resistance protein [Halothiobacillus sp.]
MSNNMGLHPPLVSFGRYSLIIGVLLIALGLIGIVAPVVLSIASAALFAWILLFGGTFWGWHAVKHGGGALDWVKAVLLVVTGVLILIKPMAGVASLALLLSFYLLMNAFASFSLGKYALPAGVGRIWMIFNGVVDVLLAGLFLFNWPTSSLWMVGLFVGISLLFDGWALVMIGLSLRKSGAIQ